MKKFFMVVVSGGVHQTKFKVDFKSLFVFSTTLIICSLLLISLSLILKVSAIVELHLAKNDNTTSHVVMLIFSDLFMYLFII
jgi:hypothetical protein